MADGIETEATKRGRGGGTEGGDGVTAGSAAAGRVGSAAGGVGSAPGRVGSAEVATVAVWRPGPGPATGDAGGGSSSGTLMYLSVFVLLLAFFILLNSMVSFDERRVGSVLQSLNDAFSLRQDLFGPGTDTRRDEILAETAAALRALGQQVLAEIPLAKVEGTGDGDTLAISLPASEMFGPGLATIRPERAGLMHRVADALSPRPAGIHVRAELLLAGEAGTDPDGRPPATVPGSSDPRVAAAGVLARHVVDLGAPAAHLTVGTEPSRDGERSLQVRLLFTVRDPAAPAVRLGELPAGGRP